jgi:hypothetical protein
MAEARIWNPRQKRKTLRSSSRPKAQIVTPETHQGLSKSPQMERAFSPCASYIPFPGALPQAGMRPRLWRSNYREAPDSKGRRPDQYRPGAKPWELIAAGVQGLKARSLGSFETVSQLPHSWSMRFSAS